MQYTIPDYYREFACIAGECPDTCCAGWQIVVDHRSLRKYRKVRGPFSNRLHNGIDWGEGVFRQHRGRCEFLDEGNLCEIYREAGKEMLCDTCRKYPRHVEEFEGLREITLSLSCPEAARIILGKEEKVRFRHGEREGQEDFGDFDFLLFTNLMEARDYLLGVIQNRQVPLRQRIAKALAFAHDLQLCAGRGELYRVEELRGRHSNSGFGPKFAEKMRRWESQASRFCLFQEIWELFASEMEVLRESWPIDLRMARRRLYGGGEDVYEVSCRKFAEAYPRWELEGEQLMVYWVSTYFCGAVYDGEIFGKIKLAAVSTLLIHELDIASFLENGERFSVENQINICYRFSRELEHSDQNLNRAEAVMGREAVFRLGNLLELCGR